MKEELDEKTVIGNSQPQPVDEPRVHEQDPPIPEQVADTRPHQTGHDHDTGGRESTPRRPVVGEAPRGWPPPLDAAALHGLAGQIVRTIEPHTEADPVALLVQFLTAFGSFIGRGPHYAVEGDEHHANLYAVLVGETSKARKGTSWGRIRQLNRSGIFGDSIS